MEYRPSFEVSPHDERNVLTPDGGLIECRHEAAAKHVRDELNEREWRIRALEDELAAANCDALLSGIV